MEIGPQVPHQNDSLDKAPSEPTNANPEGGGGFRGAAGRNEHHLGLLGT